MLVSCFPFSDTHTHTYRAAQHMCMMKRALPAMRILLEERPCTNLSSASLSFFLSFSQSGSSVSKYMLELMAHFVVSIICVRFARR